MPCSVVFDEIDRLLADVGQWPRCGCSAGWSKGCFPAMPMWKQNLAYAALDHALAEKGELKQLYQDHEEIDACLHHATLAAELSKRCGSCGGA